MSVYGVGLVPAEDEDLAVTENFPNCHSCINQLKSAGHEVTLSAKGDFIGDNQYTFEVGGAGKTFKQIRNTKIVSWL